MEHDMRFGNEYNSNYQDVGYGDYKSIHDYIAEPERVGYLKAAIRAKKQVIQMMTRELMELEGELNNEISKAIPIGR